MKAMPGSEPRRLTEWSKIASVAVDLYFIVM